MFTKAIRKLCIWALVGLILSIYATYVELRAEKDSEYTALCDVNEKISCTAVFTSVYGRGFGLIQTIFKSKNIPWIPPNGLIGVFYYSFLLISSLGKITYIWYLWLFFSSLAYILNFYLAYLLIYVLKNLCLICVAIYIVNHYCFKQIWKIREITQNRYKTKLRDSNERKSSAENILEKKFN